MSTAAEEAQTAFYDEQAIVFDDPDHSAEESGIPYQTLINLYLRDCASNERKLDMK